uniref:RING-type domain-containing protein n=1 Tax=Chrysolophus pictus TaxID=9089 RepID=A0A8C3LMS9_CHRPC
MASLTDRLWCVFWESSLAFLSFLTNLCSDFVAQLALLSVLKCLHCVVENYVGFMGIRYSRHSFTKFFHFCIISFLLLLMGLNVYLTTLHRPLIDHTPFHLFFYFEHFILSFLAITTINSYIQRCQDNYIVLLENKSFCVLCFPFLESLMRLLLYVLFIIGMIGICIFPLFAAHPTYLAMTHFRKTAADLFASYRASRNGSTLLPGATLEELPAEDNGCVICREEMGTEVTALPCCHVFHTSCLRSWFQCQWTCPMCRMPVPRVSYPELMPPDPPVQTPDPPSRPSTPPQTSPDPEPQEWYPSEEEEEEEEEEEQPSAQTLSQEIIQHYQERFTRAEHEEIAAWLLRCWDNDANSVHLEGSCLLLLGPLCNELAVDNMICRREDRTLTLWKRMLGAVRQCYRGYIMPRLRSWFTLDEAIQYLRELAVMEMLYDESFNPADPDADSCPDAFKCTPMMWLYLTMSAPPKFISTVTAVKCMCHDAVPVRLLACFLQDYDKNVTSAQRECFSLVRELAEEVKKLSREVQQLKKAKLCSSSAPTNELAVRDGQDGHPSSSALALVEDGCVPRLTFWFYLRDHGENMKKWDGKPTSALQRRVEELLRRSGPPTGSSRRRAAARRRDACAFP